MTRGGIISMAREAGAPDWWSGVDDANVPGRKWLARFAALVAAKEREECERECERISEEFAHLSQTAETDEAGRRGYLHADSGAMACLAAIRARGQA